MKPRLPRMRGVKSRLGPYLLLVTIACLFFQPSSAQESPVPDAALVEQRLSNLRESGSAADSEVVLAYEAARDFLAQAEAHAREAASFLEDMRTAPEREAEVQARVDALEQKAGPSVKPGKFEQSELDSQLLAVRSEIKDANHQLVVLDRRLAARESDASEIRERQAAINTRLAELPQDSTTPDPAAQPSLPEALDWRLQAEVQALQTERRALDARLTSQPERYRVLSVERAELALKLGHLAERVKQLEAARPRDTAPSDDGEQLEGIDPGDPVYQLATDLVEADARLREERREVNERLALERRRNEGFNRLTQAIEERHATARRAVDFAGESDVLGGVLLAHWEQRDTLKPRDPREGASEQAGGMVIRRIELEELLKEMDSVTAYLNGRLAEAGVDPEGLPEAAGATLLDLVRQLRDQLREAISVQSQYLTALGTSNEGYSGASQRFAEYQQYLEGLILWVPVYRPLWETGFGSAGAELATVMETLRATRWSVTLPAALSLVLFALLRSRRRWLLDYQLACNARIVRPRDDAISFTLLALGATLLRAAPLPLLLAGAASMSLNPGIADILADLAAILFAMIAVRLVCAPQGVGPAHFSWPQSEADPLRRLLGWLILWWLPLGAVTRLLLEAGSPGGEAVISRYAMLLLVLMPVIPVVATLRRTSAASARWHQGTANRLCLLLLAILLLTALAIAFGHVYSVAVISRGLIDTFWVGTGLLLLHGTLIRWLMVTRRRLRLAELTVPREEPAATEEGLAVESEANLIDVSTETSELIRMGTGVMAVFTLVYIWAPLLPALDAFARVTLWTSSTVVEGETLENRITLATLLTVVVLAGVTLYVAKRLPALVDLVLRSRTEVTAGARYTVSALLNYAIIGGGALAAFSALGLQWSQMQWLVAALGVGIGFGLQEIVANFISGLIILFERPIRVGDVVSTGGNDGVVTRIRIRATTIRDWDGKELLVPNKEFITGRLLNWSLSDPKVRIVLPVGIAYGSDVELALKALYEVVTVHHRVVDDPEPQIVFESFGDNALLLSARCYLDSLENRLGVVTEINRAIYSRFAELGIVIAFPQRDIHFDAEQPIRITLDTPAP